MVENISFGAWLKRRRRQLDLTQKGLAFQAGCSVGTIRKIEADERRPSRQLAALFAQQLVIPAEQHDAFIAFARSEPYEDDLIFPAPEPKAEDPTASFPDDGHAQAQIGLLRGYELKETIGEGQFGVVHRATQHVVGREVAIKVIRAQYANEPDFIRRFEAEAQIVARLEHPYIVPLYDYWREATGAYLVMRWLRGGSAEEVLADGPLTPVATIRLINQIAAALDAAHQQNVVHRDLKPANILLDEAGTAYLSDFGIAKELVGERDNTQTGILLGSPSYISPEQALAEPVTPRSDLYSLGVVIYELLTAQHPFSDVSTMAVMFKHIHEPLPPVHRQRPEMPTAVDDVIQKATAKKANERYADAPSLAAALEAALTGQSPLMPADSVVDINAPRGDLTNPYKGLRSFQEADAADFFGRQALTERLVAHLQENQFLAVVGPSGSGKSSVVTAGLVPALWQGAIAGSDKWFVTRMIPGSHPLEELEAALLRVAVNPPASLLSQLREDSRGLLRAVKRVLPGDENSQLLLVIDQFEELFTLLEDEDTRAHFLQSLVVAASAARSPMRIVITLRADFFDRPLLYPTFGWLMRRHTEVVLPLTTEELRQAIEQPARRIGVELEPGLVAEITAEVTEQPGGLPLLQYAVTELFERRQNGVLTRAAYLELGGVAGALGQRAEELYLALAGDQKLAARQLFLRLVTLGEGVEDTRRRVQVAELASIQLAGDNAQAHVVDEVMQAFGRYRLLTFDHDPITRGPTVEVAHEALLREWPRLRKWLAESRSDVRQQRLLGIATAEWVAAAEDDGFLLRGARLDQFESWAGGTELALTRSERTFLTASLAERHARQAVEETRQQRELAQAQKLAQAEGERARIESRNAQRSRRFALGLAGLLLLAMVTSIFAFVQTGEANRAQATAEASAQEAERQKRIALAQSVAAQASVVLDQNNDAELAALLAIEAAHLNVQAGGNKQWLIDNTLRPLLSEAGYQFNNSLRSHEDEVWSVAYSADGQWLATGGGGSSRAHDNTIRLWDLNDPAAEPILLAGHESKVLSVVFSPDGRWLASGSADDTIRLWDVILVTSDPTAPSILLGGHERDVSAVVFSPDGRWLASGSADDTIRLWDVTAPSAQPVVLAGHKGTINSVAFSPDGRRLASGGEDRTVRLWDTTLALAGQPAELVLFPGELDKINSVAFSPDGRWLAAGGADNTIRIWDVSADTMIATDEPIRLDDHQSTVLSVAFSPDGRWLAGSSFQELRLWDVALATVNQALEPTLLLGHQDFVNSVTFSPDGRQLASGSSDKTVRLWQVGAPVAKPIPLQGHQNWVLSLAYSPDGQWLAGGAGGYDIDNAIRLWDVAEPATEPIALTGHQNQVWALAFSPDGRQLASGGRDAAIRLWDITAATDEMPTPPTLLEDNLGAINALVFSPDGQWLASGSNDGPIRLWEMGVATRAPTSNLVRLVGHQGIVSTLDFSPDGQWLASGGEDHAIRLWNVDDLTAEPILLAGHPNGVASLAFSKDAKWLASSGVSDPEATISLWSVSDPTAEPVLLTTHQDSGSPAMTESGRLIAFSPDGQWLASGHDDRRIRLWPLADLAKEPVTLSAGDNAINAVAFSPDGQWLAAGLSNSSVMVWPTLKGLTSIGCQAVRRNLTLAEWNTYLPGESYRRTCPHLPAHPSSQ